MYTWALQLLGQKGTDFDASGQRFKSALFFAQSKGGLTPFNQRTFQTSVGRVLCHLVFLHMVDENGHHSM